MSIEPFKYLIQPVAIERDEEGKIVAERAAEVVTVFDADGAMQAVVQFEQALTQLTTEGAQNGRHQGDQGTGRGEAGTASGSPAGGLHQP